MHPLARLAIATLCACSRTELDGGAPGPLSHPRACHASRTLACRQLVVESADVALDGPAPSEWRGDHFFAFGMWGKAESFVVAGTPPTLHPGAMENFALAHDPFETISAATTNGTEQTILTDNAENDMVALHFFDANDSAGATFLMPNVLTSTTRVASYDDLTLFQYERDTRDGARVGVVDDTGALLREEPLGSQHVVEAWGLPTAYGCGFAYAPMETHPALVFMRVDGELETEAPLPRVIDSTFSAWPYDEHAIALSWVDPPAAQSCAVHLHVVRDDGAVLVERTYVSDCDAPAATEVVPTRLLVTQFGAVLRMPDWTLQLVDEAGNEIGTRVLLTVSDPSKEYALDEVAGDAYIAEITTQPFGTAPHATLIGCR